MSGERTAWPDERLDSLKDEVRELRRVTPQLATLTLEVAHIKEDVAAIRTELENRGKRSMLLIVAVIGAAATVIASLVTMVGTLAGVR